MPTLSPDQKFEQAKIDIRYQEHKDAIARDELRNAIAEDNESENSQSRLIMAAAVGMAALTLLGVKAINYNHAHSAISPNTPQQIK